jgi:hypothetical protein
MSPKQRQLIQNQARVKVIAQTHDNASANKIWFATLAAAVFAAVFYFFSYYFWGNEVWLALSGG